MLLSACPAKEDAAGNTSEDPEVTVTEVIVPEVSLPTDAAWRFLSHATFGPTQTDIDRVKLVGPEAWIDEQFALPAGITYRKFLEDRDTEIKRDSIPKDSQKANTAQNIEAFYTKALTEPAQLRNRLTFALSEIFVISTVTLPNEPYIAGYLDMLDRASTGNYRSLLESVSKSPAMGIYLTFRSNQKESAVRIPDQNYAREIMQLFSIGLYELNNDGTLALGSDKKPKETYNSDDIKGLSKVFTGWSDARGSANSGVDNTQCFLVQGPCYNRDSPYLPMESYPVFHSTSVKSFLGVTIPEQSTADAQASLTTALDKLANHRNAAPFFCKQLIQRLVSSNPSPEYVGRVVAKFLSSNGDIKTTVKAILLDSEATDDESVANPSAGKVREPILRLTAILRAFGFSGPSYPGTTSHIANVGITDTSDVSTSFGQSPLSAPSVFNFFRPGYVPPGSETAKNGMVAPELQITDETSVTGYINAVQSLLTSGIGGTIATRSDGIPGVRLNLLSQRSLAAKSTDELMTDLTNRLLGGQISNQLKTEIIRVLNTMPVPALTTSPSNQAAVNAALDLRVNAAILMTVASPEFLIIK